MEHSPQPHAPTTGAPAAPHRRRERRRKKSLVPKILWSVVGLAAVVIAAVVAGRSWVQSYLKSPEFAARLSETAGERLGAECRIEDLSWQESGMHAGVISARGREGSVFRSINLSDVRAQVDLGALWDRTWRVDRVRIAALDMDFSPGGRKPVTEATNTPAPPAGSSQSEAPGWLQKWLPTQVEAGPVQIDGISFIRKNAAGEVEWEGKGFPAIITPKLKTGTAMFTSTGGTFRKKDLKQRMKVGTVQAVVRQEGVALERFEASVGQARVSANGIWLGSRDPSLQLNLTVTGAGLDDWITEDWRRRFSGTVNMKAMVQGDPAEPWQLDWKGDAVVDDAVIQALPLLDIIAKKTRNAGFLRLQIKEAKADFHRRGNNHWVLSGIRADAPGQLRLKGEAQCDSSGNISGNLILGIVPGTLRYLAGAEQTVFLPTDRAELTAAGKAWLTPDDNGHLWVAMQVSGTLEDPMEDLSDRLAMAWFNATVDEVQALSMEAAATAAATAADAANSIMDKAPPLIEKAPALLEEAPGLLNRGVDEGMKLLDDLLPR